MLADIGVLLDGKVVARGGDMTLYKINGPWHLLDAVQAVDNDSWCQNWCSYTYFKPHQSGTLVIDIGRQGYKGRGEAGRATLSIGPVRVETGRRDQLKRRRQADPPARTKRAAGRRPRPHRADARFAS